MLLTNVVVCFKSENWFDNVSKRTSWSCVRERY